MPNFSSLPFKQWFCPSQARRYGRHWSLSLSHKNSWDEHFWGVSVWPVKEMSLVIPSDVSLKTFDPVMNATTSQNIIWLNQKIHIQKFDQCILVFLSRNIYILTLTGIRLQKKIKTNIQTCLFFAVQFIWLVSTIIDAITEISHLNATRRFKTMEHVMSTLLHSTTIHFIFTFHTIIFTVTSPGHWNTLIIPTLEMVTWTWWGDGLKKIKNKKNYIYILSSNVNKSIKKTYCTILVCRLNVHCEICINIYTVSNVLVLQFWGYLLKAIVIPTRKYMS